jgi:hypothetical protein
MLKKVGQSNSPDRYLGKTLVRTGFEVCGSSLRIEFRHAHEYDPELLPYWLRYSLLFRYSTSELEAVVLHLANRRYLLLPMLVWSATLAAARASEPISSEQFKQLQTAIKPGAAEDKWDKIPWMTELWEARRRAAALGKPILVWEMDGHPLACV